jgi:hypothetical protein
MRAVTAAQANTVSSAANTAADDAPAGCKNPSDPVSIEATQAEGNLEVSRNRAANISTPSTGVWSLVDKCLDPLERISFAIQGKHENLIQNVVNTGNQGSLAANVVSLGESMLPVTGKIGTAATNVNLVMTGVQGFLAGLRERDLFYGLFKLADALMFMVPRELQLGMRIGPSGYNLALATRQEKDIKQYSSFSQGIKQNLQQIKEYIQSLGKFGLINGYKPGNAHESKAYTVGGPIKSFIGSTGMILSYLPFMPHSIKNVLRSTGYLSRLAGAVTLNFSEAMSKHAQSQFSGAAKIDFLAGDVLDFMNKAAKITKHTLVNNMKMPENSMPVRIAAVLQSFFKNSTQAAGSLGRVVSARGVEVGITQEQYKTSGFRGILSKWMESHMDALLGIPAKGTAVAANNIVPAQLSVEAKLKAAGAADKVAAAGKVAGVGSSSSSKASSSRDDYSSSREDYSATSIPSSRGAAGSVTVVEKPYSVAAIANKDSLVNNNPENSNDQLVNKDFESRTDQLVNDLESRTDQLVNDLESRTDQLVSNDLESLTDQLLGISLATK